MRSSNPSLNDGVFRHAQSQSMRKRMTLDGAVRKTFILLVLLIASAAYTWNLSSQGHEMKVFIFGGLIGGFAVALLTIFVPRISPFTAPVYALLEGLFLGAVSAQYAGLYDGIVMQAIVLTLCVFFLLLALYATKVIRPSKNFKIGLMVATSAIFLAYLANFVLRIFGNRLPFLHDSGPIGIGISLVIVGVAALNLILDFDFIKKSAASVVPKYMEWYAAFSLMITLIWLYLEILRLLSKLRRN